jgi:uncharacterized damage-inducible protein DinB
MTAVDWNDILGDQLGWHWTYQLRPRLDGLTDEEYLWEPAPGVPTIAWRLAHITDDCLAARTASHFGGPPPGGAESPGGAVEALASLDEAYAAWSAGVRGLGQEGLARPCGAAEGGFASYPLAALVLHINRETIHHGAEVALLRDLYAHRPTSTEETR